MKAVWDNYFFDLKECGLTEDEFADIAGKAIRDTLDGINDAIKKYDLQKAFKLIEEAKVEY